MFYVPDLKIKGNLNFEIKHVSILFIPIFTDSNR